ncbi:hypothetical protein BH10PAT2_BH10PAT2_0900 [soil metagenome]
MNQLNFPPAKRCLESNPFEKEFIIWRSQTLHYGVFASDEVRDVCLGCWVKGVIGYAFQLNCHFPLTFGYRREYLVVGCTREQARIERKFGLFHITTDGETRSFYGSEFTLHGSQIREILELSRSIATRK